MVDTNLMVLLLVGLVNPERIQHFKRTQDFTVDDFRQLRKLLDELGTPLIATPHILSQVSDLTDLPGPERVTIRALFKKIIQEIDEKYDAANLLVRNFTFRYSIFALGRCSVTVLDGRSNFKRWCQGK